MLTALTGVLGLLAGALVVAAPPSVATEPVPAGSVVQMSGGVAGQIFTGSWTAVSPRSNTDLFGIRSDDGTLQRIAGTNAALDAFPAGVQGKKIVSLSNSGSSAAIAFLAVVTADGLPYIWGGDGTAGSDTATSMVQKFDDAGLTSAAALGGSGAPATATQVAAGRGVLGILLDDGRVGVLDTTFGYRVLDAATLPEKVVQIDSADTNGNLVLRLENGGALDWNPDPSDAQGVVRVPKIAAVAGRTASGDPLTEPLADPLVDVKGSSNGAGDAVATTASGAVYSWQISDGTEVDSTLRFSSHAPDPALQGKIVEASMAGESYMVRTDANELYWWTATRSGYSTAAAVAGKQIISLVGGLNSHEVLIEGAPALSVATRTLPLAFTGSAYSQTLSAVGGTAPYSWSVTTGSLPAGLSLDASTGVISGTPSGAPGKSSFTVTATDSASPAATATADLSIMVRPGPLTVTTTSLPDATVGSAYDQTLAASGGTAPYTWSISDGTLPAGLSLDASTGAITGTPSGAPGKSSFTVTATDSVGTSATADLSITVAPGVLAVTTASLPDATVGSAYDQTLAAAGGTGPYTWAVTSGSLPDGLSLDGSTGKITGTPSGTPGKSSFTVTATDNQGTPATASQDLSITVAAAPVTTVASTTKLSVSPATAAIGTARTVTATVTKTGGTPTGNVTFKSGSITKTVALSNGKATWRLPALAVGNHPVTASYAGDDTTDPSTAAAVNVKVTKASSRVSAAVKKSAKKVKLTITVKTASGVSPKGTVTITLKGKTRKTVRATVNANGKATVTVKKLKKGKYKATVKYAGNGSVTGSTTIKKFKA